MGKSRRNVNMLRRGSWLCGVGAMLLTVPPAALGQETEGARLFNTTCARCHMTGAADQRAPTLDVLRQLRPEAIDHALSTGSMRVQGSKLTRTQRRAVAVYTSGQEFTDLATAGTPTR